MKKALVLQDTTCVVALIKEEKTYITISKLIDTIAKSPEFWDVKYLNLTKEGLIPLKSLSSLLVGEIVRFDHLEKYAEDINNFLVGGI